MARTQTIKVSKKEWEMLQKARGELARRGYKDIEDELEDDVEPDDLGAFLGGLALGAIAALGAAALITLLSKGKGGQPP